MESRIHAPDFNGSGSIIEHDAKLDKLAMDIRSLPDDRRKLLLKSIERRAYTIPEAAEAISVGPITIRRYLKKGSLKGFRIGLGKRGDWRISVEELDKFIRKAEEEAETFVQNEGNKRIGITKKKK